MPKKELSIDVEVLGLDENAELIKTLEKKCEQMVERIEQICASTIHEQLKKVGITYNVPLCQWQFLDLGQEKSLAALLYKLFEMYHWTPAMLLLRNDLKEKGKFEEFTKWAAEHAIDISDSDEEGMEKHEIKLNPVSDRKELPEDKPPTQPDRPESSDYPGC